MEPGYKRSFMDIKTLEQKFERAMILHGKAEAYLEMVKFITSLSITEATQEVLKDREIILDKIQNLGISCNAEAVGIKAAVELPS